MIKWMFLFGIFLVCAIANGATITGSRAVPGNNQAVMSINGEIKPGDEKLVRDHLSSLKKDGHVSVFIKSNGGDVQTAMQIGRMLRQYDSSVRTDMCLSSCVLVLVGGVDRHVTSLPARGWGVGLHRPYFGTLPPNLSSSEIAQKREQLKNEVATFIKEMNISSRLLDLMEAIPPEKMKMLTASEVSDLGLDAPDPVWDEKIVAKEASYYGITSVEFRIRRASIEAKCPSSYPEVNLEKIQDDIDCREGVPWGLAMKEYRLTKKRYDAWTLATFGEDKLRSHQLTAADITLGRKCKIRFMAFGDQSCGK